MCQECQSTWCLFNLVSDPCEFNNVAKDNEALVHSMLHKLELFQATAIDGNPVGCDPIMVDIDMDVSGGEGGKAWRPCDMPELI